MAVNNEIMRLAVAVAGFELVDQNDVDGGAFSVNGLEVAWEGIEESDEMMVWCSVGSLLANPDSALMDYLLQVNCFGSQTAGGHLGLYGVSRTLVYSYRFVPNSDERVTADVLKAFVTRAFEFLGKLQELQSSNQEEGEAADLVANDSIRI